MMMIIMRFEKLYDNNYTLYFLYESDISDIASVAKKANTTSEESTLLFYFSRFVCFHFFLT